MIRTLAQTTSDHRELVRIAAEAAGLVDPIAVDMSGYDYWLLRVAKRGPLIPIQGTLVRSWCLRGRYGSGASFGIRLYDVEGIRLARCVAIEDESTKEHMVAFYVVARADYLHLFKAAVRLMRESAPPGPPPILPDGLLDNLRQNTLGYLQRDNLRRIRELGGRPRRGILLSGPPGNGKTSACRWMWQLCHELRYEFRLVSPDDYQAARKSCNPAAAVKELFQVHRRGIVFFDDMDLALRDRTLTPGSDDQAVFLGAMDGIEAKEGVVYIFTTNCPLNEIDPAFKRPGRIDLVLQFDAPTAALRRKLLDRWHDDIKAGIDIDRAVADTEGWSFAEVEELKNLLILHYLEHQVWSWPAAKEQYEQNRHDLQVARRGAIGFQLNGHATAEL